jgi:DNA-binding response OmpR family regulator
MQFQAQPARRALECLEQAGVDLVLVDVPIHLDGLDLCRRLRARTTNPILLLGMFADDAHVLEAYDAGADECIPTPVGTALLLAKVRAWLRHGWTVRAESLLPLQVAGVRLVPARREVSTGDGAAVRLTALELRLLYLLMCHPMQVLAPERMIPRVWGPAGGGRPRQLSRMVGRLREKIEANPRRPRILLTVRGQGYAFCG